MQNIAVSMWRKCYRCGLPIGDLEALTSGVSVWRKGKRVGIAHMDCAKEGTIYTVDGFIPSVRVVFDDEDTFEPPLLDFGVRGEGE